MRRMTFKDLQAKNADATGFKGINFDTGLEHGQTYFHVDVDRANEPPAELVELIETMMNRMIEEYELSVEALMDDNIIAECLLGVKAIDASTSDLCLTVYFVDTVDTYYKVDKTIEPDSEIYQVVKDYFTAEVMAYIFKRKEVD